MAKKFSVHIPYLCEEARNKFFYFEDAKSGQTYIVDEKGTFGIVTKDPYFINALRIRKSVTLTWRDIKPSCEGILTRKHHDAAEITKAMYACTGGYARVIRGTNDQKRDYAVCVNNDRLCMVHPECVEGVSADGRKGAVILTCPECYVIILPVVYWRGREDDGEREAAMLALADAMEPR